MLSQRSATPGQQALDNPDLHGSATILLDEGQVQGYGDGDGAQDGNRDAGTDTAPNPEHEGVVKERGQKALEHKEIVEKKFISEWNISSPSKTSIGTTAAMKAWDQMEPMKEKEAGAKQELRGVVQSANSTQNELKAEISVLRNESKHLRDEISDFPSADGNEQAVYNRSVLVAKEAKAKLDIATNQRKIAESNYQVVQLKLKPAKAKLYLSQVAKTYADQSYKAGKAISAGRTATVEALKALVSNATRVFEKETGIYKEYEDEYERLYAIVHASGPADCQVLDFLHRSLVKKLVALKGFATAEARCAALKQQEEKVCSGKPEAGWLKAATEMRAEEAKMDTHRFNVDEARGMLNKYKAAEANATNSELLAKPVVLDLKDNAVAEELGLAKAEVAVKHFETSPAVVEKTVKAREKGESQLKATSNTLDAARDAQEVKSKAYVVEQENKAKEKEQKEEIQSKLEVAVKAHEELVEKKTLQYDDAQQNVTALTATTQNLQDIAVAAKVAAIVDPTAAKQREAAATAYEASGAKNKTKAAVKVEEEIKSELTELESQAPNSTLDAANEFTDIKNSDVSEAHLAEALLDVEVV